MVFRIILAAMLVISVQAAFANSDVVGFGARHSTLDDSLPEYTLQGRISIDPTSGEHSWPWYFLDTDNDGIGDYHLFFGPPSYQPPSGAQRPVAGDQVSVVAGMFSCSGTVQPMMVVYELNGQVWRGNGTGTGGSAGHQNLTFHHCSGSIDNVTPEDHEIPRVQVNGYVTFPLCDPPTPNPPGVFYYRNTTDTTEAFYTYYINLGTHWDSLPPFDPVPRCLVAAMMPLPDSSACWLIAYDFAGYVIREPGDTLNLVFQLPQSVEPVLTGEPVSYLTASNYPNPFNVITTIMYSVPSSGEVTVTVYDLLGHEVATLMRGFQHAGSYAVSWNGSDAASGIYFYRVQTNGKAFVNRMVLLK